jgi:hypothetical protein
MGRILQFDPDTEPQDCNILTEPTNGLEEFTCDDLPTNEYYKIASVGPNGDTVKPYFCFRILEHALQYIDQQQERGFRGRIDIQHFHRVSGGVERPIIADFRVTDEGIVNLPAKHSQ